MIRINQIRLPLGHDRQDLLAKVSGILGIPAGEIDSLDMIKQSVDARKKPDIFYSYVVDVRVKGITGKKEEKLVRKLRGRDVSVQDSPGYRLPEPGTQNLSGRLLLSAQDRQDYSAGFCWQGRDTGQSSWNGARMWMPGQGGWLGSGKTAVCVLIPMCSSGKAGQEHFQMES